MSRWQMMSIAFSLKSRRTHETLSRYGDDTGHSRAWPPTVTAILPFNAAARSIMSCGFACRNVSGGRDSRITKTDRLPSGLAAWQIARIDELQARYNLRFGNHYGQHTALANYAYLDLLHQAWTNTNRPVPQGGAVADVGAQTLVCAHLARVLPSRNVDRCGCGGIPALPDRVQPL